MNDTHDERGGGCVFCAIIARTAPATIVREWPDAIAFVPLGPVVPGGHILVVPRRHVADAVKDPTVTAATMARAAELAAEHEASNILTSIGRAATQSIFHLHIHVIRRAVGDQLMVPWGTTGDPQAPHSCKRSARAEKLLAAVTARAEEAEALVAGFGPACCVCGRILGYRNYRDQLFCWPCADGEPKTADAAPGGLSGPVERPEASGGSFQANTSSILPQGLSEAEPPRYTSAWCWAPNPNGPLCCERLRDHEPPHRRGERTWNSDTTEGRP